MSSRQTKRSWLDSIPCRSFAMNFRKSFWGARGSNESQFALVSSVNFYWSKVLENWFFWVRTKALILTSSLHESRIRCRVLCLEAALKYNYYHLEYVLVTYFEPVSCVLYFQEAWNFVHHTFSCRSPLWNRHNRPTWLVDPMHWLHYRFEDRHRYKTLVRRLQFSESQECGFPM